MLFVFIFAILQLSLVFLAYCHELFIIGNKTKVKDIKIERNELEEKAPTTKNVEGANCITWCAKTGEVLEEKVL